MADGRPAEMRSSSSVALQLQRNATGTSAPSLEGPAVRRRITATSRRETDTPIVIITEDAPSYGVLSSVRALRAGGYEPWVAVTGPDSYAARSRARGGTVRVPHPAAGGTRYAERLARAADELGAVGVLPGTDLALLALAGREELFPSDVAVGNCSQAEIHRATDKAWLGSIGADAELPSPPSQIVSAEDGPGAYELGFPAVIKPLHTVSEIAGRGLVSVGVRWVATPRELARAMSAMPGERWLVQEYLAGHLEAVVGVAWRGDVVCAAQQQAERIYPRNCGISAYARTIAADPDLRDRVERLIAQLGWSGIFQIQMLNTPDGHYAIDINLRPYGSLALTVAAGLNLPAIWANLLTGRPVHPGGYRVGVRYRSEERDAGALITALAGHDWRTAVEGLRPRRGTVHAVFSVRDPLPSLNGLRHAGTALTLLGRDAVRTALSEPSPQMAV